MSRKLNLGSITLGKLKTDIRETIGIFEQKDLTDGLLNSNINEAIQFLYNALGWKNKSEYRDSITIPIIKSVYCNGLTGSGYVAALSQLTVPITASWVNDTGFDSDWIGASGTLYDVANSVSHPVIIRQIVNANQVIVQSSGIIPNITGANLIVNIDTSVNLETNDIDLTLIPAYKQINKIEKIMSTTGGLCIGGEDEKGNVKIDSNVFESINMNYNYADSIIYYRQGETLRFKIGVNLTSYGTRTLYFVITPAVAVNDSDLLDVKDTDLILVKKFAVVTVISGLPKDKVKVSIPDAWFSWVNELQGIKAGAVEQLPTKD